MLNRMNMAFSFYKVFAFRTESENVMLDRINQLLENH